MAIKSLEVAPALPIDKEISLCIAITLFVERNGPTRLDSSNFVSQYCSELSRENQFAAATVDLVNAGVIQALKNYPVPPPQRAGRGDHYELTALGRAWARRICSTLIPRATFVDENGHEV